MKYRSLGKNAILNGIKSMMSLLFPLISFPYVSKVLQVENLGKYNFANSIISYFILISALGISTYSIREGAKLRDTPEKISEFASEVFSINLISTLIAYLLFGITLIIVPKFHYYYGLLLIFSLQIIFTTIGVEWIYSIYEDYAYITIRSILVQLLSLIAMFIFIKKPEDYYIYAIITVFANAGSNIFNWYHAKKFCHIRFITNIEWEKHLAPILMIFATTIATTIYVNSDITILGFLTNDFCVGIYSVSVKIYKIVKTLLSAILIVSIPRLSNYVGNQRFDLFEDTFSRIFKAMLAIVLPAVSGLFILSEEIVLIISDQSYVQATSSMRILSIALVVCLFGWLFNSCVLIPFRKENKVLIATIVSALVNFVLNIILIPFWKENAAAFTTLVAELCQMMICIYYSRDLVKLNGILKEILKVGIGCLSIFTFCFAMFFFDFSVWLYTMISIIGSIMIYIFEMIILKEEIVTEGYEVLKKRICDLL